MWKQLLDFSEQLIALTRDVQQNKEALKAHGEEIKEICRELLRLTEILQEVRSCSKRASDNAAHERENLMLHLENALLKFERQEVGDTIRVTVIAPGTTESELANTISDPEMKKAVVEQFRVDLIPAEAIARTIAYAVE